MASPAYDAATQSSSPNTLTVKLVLQPGANLANTKFGDLLATSTIGDLKSKICQGNVHGPEPQRQRLIYRGTALDDDDAALISVVGESRVG